MHSRSRIWNVNNQPSQCQCHYTGVSQVLKKYLFPSCSALHSKYTKLSELGRIGNRKNLHKACAMTPRLKLDLFNGMRVLAFVSFVMGVSTFIVCGWTFLSNRLNIDFKLFTNSVVVTAKLVPNVSDPGLGTSASPAPASPEVSSDPADVQVLDMLRASVVRCSIIVVLLVLVQIVSAAFIIGSSAQTCRARIKMWFVLNSGINVAILICLTLPLMYQIQHSRHLQTTTLEMEPGNGDSDPGSEPKSNSSGGGSIPRINYINSFYIGLGTEFFVQFITLISCLLLMRFHRYGRVHYENVGNM